MAKSKRQLPLSSMTAGIQRRDGLAGADQTVDALDVIADHGELRRRDGYADVCSVPGHGIPDPSPDVTIGSLGVLVTERNGARVLHGDRTVLDITGFDTAFIGWDRPFNTIDWRKVSWVGAPTQTKRLEAAYWNGDGWQPLPIHDGTQAQGSNGAVLQPLSQTGQIAWHPKLTPGWAQVFVGLLMQYWVRLRIVDVETVALVPLEGVGALVQPGMTVGNAQPVNGLFPARLGERHVVVLGHDRADRGGLEAGAALSVWEGKGARALGLVAYEGAGVCGSFTWPQWQRGVTNVGVPGTVYGSSGRLTNFDNNYDFTDEGLFGAPVAENLAADVPVDQPGPSTPARVNLAQPLNVGNAAGCFLYVTAGGEEGPVAGDSRLILFNDATRIYVYPEFSSPPDADTRFAIYRPGYHFRTLQAPDDSYRIDAVEERSLRWDSGPYAANPDDAGLLARPNHFAIEMPLPWSIPSSRRWCAAYDTITKRLLLTNGASGLLSFDGERLRRLKADYESDVALALIGALPDSPDIALNYDPRAVAQAQLRTTPPAGKYIVDYQGRLCVAGLEGRPWDVAYSFPGTANNIWPKQYQAMIRDGLNSPITGLATLSDRLVIFTSSTIHIATIDEHGFLNPRPATQGIGFVSHHAVVPLPMGGASVLVGPSGDGVYAFDGTDAHALLDQWADVLDGGVNAAALSGAVATGWRQKNYYVLAVPGSGSSSNNRILIYDYAAKAWWAWSAPFGVSSLATDYDDAGNEVLLIGTDDGFVMTLADRSDDAGLPLFAYARSPTVQPGAAVTFANTRLNLTAKVLGPAERLGVAAYVQKRNNPATQGAAPVTATPVAYDSQVAVFDDPAAIWSDDQYKTLSLNIPTGIKGTQIQFQVSGWSRWALRSATLETRPLSTRTG